MGKRGAQSRDEFSFVSPVVKYVLFFFNMIFWVISLVLISIGVYARMTKHTEAAMAHLSVDPAILLIVVGSLMFLITFCGCIGSLRENICLLQTARGKVTEVINRAIVHYRDDLDLQNLIDFGQKEFSCCGGISYKDWSLNMYFNCTDRRSPESCGVPFSCCLLSKDKSVINTMCGYEMQALKDDKAGEVIHTSGCIDKLVNWIHSNLFLLGGIALGLAVPQLVGIFLSQNLINQIKDQIQLQQYSVAHRSDPWR
ncbi:tetraspanin-33 isoform X7 [Alosa sapidissima]|uniref:tetraspanin-33 isoform X7 n=1 Tax=Alosa sapidissima TaxID=34773 RepID=UPI001C0A2DC5|nr:tetraspanin-33 isoform X7 [Alosa sapidissima]